MKNKSMKKFSKALTASVAMMMLVQLMGMSALTAQAADSGFKAPTANSNVGWDNPERAHVSDNSRTVANDDNDIVQYSTFNFAEIPAGSTINGIEVTVEGYASWTNQTARQADISLSWDNGASYTTGSGVKRTDLSESITGNDSTKTFGGAADTWNRVWSPSDFSNANFRMKLDAITASANLNVDFLQVKVYYTTSDTTAPTVTINQAASQADPASSSPIKFDVVFSEAVTGFAASDVVISGTATHGTATLSGSGPAYTVNVPVTIAGSVIANIPASVATDAASLPNAASTSTDNTVAYAPSPIPFAKGMVSLSFDDGWKSFYTYGVPVLDAAGYKSTAYINSQPIQDQWADYMIPADLVAMHTNGHDIAAHTRTHADLTTLDAAGLVSEINGNVSDLQAWSITPVGSLAYPYGSYNETVINAVKAAGISGGRTVEEGNNFTNTNPYELKSQEVDGDTTVEQVKSWIDTAKTQKAWLILLFHEVRETCGTVPSDNYEDHYYCVTKSNFQAITDYLKAQSMTVPTVAQGLNVMNGGAIPDTIAPVITLAGANPQTIVMGSGYTELGAATDDGSPVTIDKTAFVDAIGSYSVKYDAVDAAGNHAVQKIRTVNVVDGTAPIVTISAPAIGAKVKGTETVEFTVDDASAATQCSVDNAVWIPCTSQATLLSDITGFAGLPDGAFILYVKGTDLANNVGSDGRSLVKDTFVPPVPPTIITPVEDNSNVMVVTSDTSSLPYSISKKAKRKITFTFTNLALTKKKFVKVRLNGRKVTVLRVRRSGNDSLVTVTLKYRKWAVGNYNLAMSWKNQIKVPYLTKKGAMKSRKGWESGNVNSENIFSII